MNGASISSRYRLKANHFSITRPALIYATAGDVVQGYLIQDGKDDRLIFYIDAHGERFCCTASLLQEVPASMPLSKKFVPVKNR